MSPSSTLVAFQGSPGAFSHLACQQHCPDRDVLTCPSFDACFDAVETHRAELAMLPVENSMAGRVADIHRLLPVRNLHVIAEHYLPVRHQLLAPPGTRMEQLRTVRSHPQALAQCRRYLTERGLKPVAASDTSGAASEVAELEDPSIAAIASSIAGRIWGLETLDSNIQDALDNTTRFLVMAREPVDPGPDSGPVITSCVFKTRNIPSALYKALGGFATNGVNLLKLESYQVGGSFRWMQFSIDFQGHPRHKAIRHALEELEFFSTSVRILGTYPAHPYRVANQLDGRG